MSSIDSEINRIKEYIITQKEKKIGLFTPDMESFRFLEKTLDENEKKFFDKHRDDFLYVWSKTFDDTEVMISDREWDRSRTFDPRPDEIAISIVLRTLTDNELNVVFRDRWNAQS